MTHDELARLADPSAWSRESIQRVIEAASRDSVSADLHFLAGRMLLAGSPAKAREYFVRARDLDQLRFRTSTDFNAAILSVQRGAGSRVVDMEEVFSRETPARIPGSELITEHLHPYARGYFLMARAYADAMRSMGLVAPADAWPPMDSAFERLQWERRTVTDLDERIARRRTDVLTSGWPFKDQFPIVDAIPSSDTLGQFAEKATDGTWDWRTAHEAALAFHARRGNFEEVLREDRALLSQSPNELGLYHTLARHCFEMGRLEEMRDVLLSSLRVAPSLLAHRALGDYWLSVGKPSEAVTQYRALLQLPQSPQERLENGYQLSQAFMRNGQMSEAKAKLIELLNLDPDFQPALKLLGDISSGRVR